MSRAMRQIVGPAFVASYRAAARIRGKMFSLAVAGSFDRFGRRSVLQPPVRLTGERFIAVGDHVYIGPNSWLQVLGEDHRDRIIEIGDGTSIVGHCTLSAAVSVRLGKRVLFARNIYVADHTHAYGDTGAAILDQGIASIRPVEICDGAWLGQNVVVGPGVRIGAGAVIGANSVVLEDVPDYSVAVGAPARVVRSYETPLRPTE